MAINTSSAKMQFLNDAGSDLIQYIGPGGNTAYLVNQFGGIQVSAVPITANGAINPRSPGYYVITKAGIAALTLAAPIAGADDGLEIEIASVTAFAHSITATGLLYTSSAAVNSITFPAFAGASVILTAYQGKWIVQTGGLGTYTTA